MMKVLETDRNSDAEMNPRWGEVKRQLIERRGKIIIIEENPNET